MKFCQSCGMPLQAEDQWGTNADGSLNEEYCCYCYQKGAFTQYRRLCRKDFRFRLLSDGLYECRILLRSFFLSE